MNKRDKIVGSTKGGVRLFARYINLRITELYWTLCTLVGLKHLHDGSKARVSVMKKVITNKAEIPQVKTEEEERINRLIDEATTLQLSRTSKYLRSHKQDLVLVAVRERTTPEPSKLPSPFVYAMQ
ncbi:MAG TPA: hypothetical protein VIF37_15825 [Methylobacter sp.]|jgi:hypothetical protein